MIGAVQECGSPMIFSSDSLNNRGLWIQINFRFLHLNHDSCSYIRKSAKFGGEKLPAFPSTLPFPMTSLAFKKYLYWTILAIPQI